MTNTYILILLYSRYIILLEGMIKKHPHHVIPKTHTHDIPKLNDKLADFWNKQKTNTLTK